MASLCNGIWVVNFVEGTRFPQTIRAKDRREQRRIIEEIWGQNDTAQLLQVDVYDDGSINVSIPPREIA